MALLLGVLLGTALSIIVGISFFTYLQRAHDNKLMAMSSHYESTIQQLNAAHEEELSRAEAQISELTARTLELEESLETMQNLHTADSGTISMWLVKKYMYVIKEAPLNKGVTLDLIAYNDQLCKEKNVNPHLVWAIINHESRFNAKACNPETDARGFGQFIPSTAKSVYENMLKLGSYTHDLAYDPYISIQLIVEYLRDINTRQTNNVDVLNEYGGYTAGRYYREIKAYMDAVGTDATVTVYN